MNNLPKTFDVMDAIKMGLEVRLKRRCKVKYNTDMFKFSFVIVNDYLPPFIISIGYIELYAGSIDSIITKIFDSYKEHILSYFIEE